MLKTILLFLSLSTPTQAADIGLSVRAVGMGNAYTAIVNNSESLYYNPAGFAKMNGFQWTILDAGLGLNNIESYQDYLEIAGNADGDFAATMSELYGDEVTAYTGGKSVMSVGGLAFGAYGIADANFLVNNPVYPNIESTYRLDYGFMAAAGTDLIPNMLDVGMQVRRVTRQGGSAPVGVSTIATLSSESVQSEFNKKGTGYAFDWGATLKFPGSLSPVVAFTWRDMGDTNFEPDNTNVEAPSPVKQEHIVGLGLTYESLMMDIRTAIDYRFMNHTDQQLGKKLNLGVEFSWPVIDVRGGFHQGYYSLGASFDLWIMRIDAATYGVELGKYPGQLEDRRYMVQVSFEFGIDPTSFSFFKLSRPSAKNHNRKLRR